VTEIYEDDDVNFESQIKTDY